MSTRESTQSVLIVGTGALATLFAARLAAAGADVQMLGSWQPALQALRQGGARLLASEGREQAYPVRVAESARECRGATQAIVLVKAWQTERAADQLAECLAHSGVALTLQNGLGNYEKLAERLGGERVALGATTTGATLLGPGLVRPAGNGKISIPAGSRTDGLAAALRLAGFEVETVTDARTLLWRKLVVNSSINPLTALLGIRNGELLERPAARRLLSMLARETAAVATAEGADLGVADAAALAEEVARSTAGNYSSMLQDVRRGAPTEIEAICGAITRKGREHGIVTPANDTCRLLVQALVDGKTTPHSADRRPARHAAGSPAGDL